MEKKELPEFKVENEDEEFPVLSGIGLIFLLLILGVATLPGF